MTSPRPASERSSAHRGRPAPRPAPPPPSTARRRPSPGPAPGRPSAERGSALAAGGAGLGEAAQPAARPAGGEKDVRREAAPVPGRVLRLPGSAQRLDARRGVPATGKQCVARPGARRPAFVRAARRRPRARSTPGPAESSPGGAQPAAWGAAAAGAPRSGSLVAGCPLTPPGSAERLGLLARRRGSRS